MATRQASGATLDAVLGALPAGVALALVAILPSFINLAAEQVFEEEKSLLLRAGALVASPGVLFAAGSWRRLAHPAVLAFAAMVAVLGIATLVNGAERDAFFGAYLRRHGWITWIALLVMLLSLVQAARSGAGRRLITVALVIGAVWPSAYLLLQRAGADWVAWVVPSEAFRSGSTLGNPVLLGGYLAVIVPVTIAAAWRSRRWWIVAAAALQVAALFVSGSRGAAVAAFAAAATAAGSALWARAPRRIALGMTIAAALALAGMVLLPALRPVWIAERLDPTVGTARVRILIWQDTTRLLRESGYRAWIGHGPEALRWILPRYYSPEIGYWEQSDVVPDRAHNDTLDMLASGGVAGAVLQAAFFGAVLMSAWRVRDLPLRAGLAAAVVAHFVELQFGIASVTSRLSLLAVAALIIEEQRSDSVVPERSSPPAAWRWIAAAALLGAATPWLSTLPARLGAPASSGTEAQFVDYLTRQSLATPAIYAGALAVALLLARATAAGGRPARAWVQFPVLAAAIWLVIPLSLNPSRTDAFSAAGTFYANQQRWVESAIAYGEAAKRSPAVPDYHTSYARVLVEQAIRSEPPAAAPLLQRARDAYLRARELTPADPNHARHLASWHRVQAWRDAAARETTLAEADRILEAATGRTPTLPALWVDWAWVDVDRNRLAEAMAKVDRALAMNAAHVDARILRGDLRLRGGGLAAALEDFDAALARDPQNARALQGRADATAGLRAGPVAK